MVSFEALQLLVSYVTRANQSAHFFCMEVVVVSLAAVVDKALALVTAGVKVVPR